AWRPRGSPGRARPSAPRGASGVLRALQEGDESALGVGVDRDELPPVGPEVVEHERLVVQGDRRDLVLPLRLRLSHGATLSPPPPGRHRPRSPGRTPVMTSRRTGAAYRGAVAKKQARTQGGTP